MRGPIFFLSFFFFFLRDWIFPLSVYLNKSSDLRMILNVALFYSLLYIMSFLKFIVKWSLMEISSALMQTVKVASIQWASPSPTSWTHEVLHQHIAPSAAKTSPPSQTKKSFCGEEKTADMSVKDNALSCHHCRRCIYALCTHASDCTRNMHDLDLAHITVFIFP